MWGLKKSPSSPAPAKEVAKTPQSAQQIPDPVPEEPPELDDNTVLANIPKKFYEVEHVDGIELLFSQMPPNILSNMHDNSDLEKYLAQELREKERALDIIISQLSTKVMSNYNSFVQGVTQIHDLGVDLQYSSVICKNSRNSLKNAKEDLIQKVLLIIEKSRKMNKYNEILDNMLQIRKIVHLEQDLKKSLAGGDFPAAINLCIECRNSINSCKHFVSVNDLNGALLESYNTVQEKMDQALMGITRKFQPETYSKILIAYRLLGQSHKFMEKLQQAILSSINDDTKNVLYSNALRSEENIAKMEIMKKMKFRDLCGVIAPEHFMDTLFAVLGVLCDIMYTHHQTVQWHAGHRNLVENEPAPQQEQNGETTQQTDANGAEYYMQEVEAELKKFSKSMWDDIQRKMSIMISTPAIATFKIDEFLRLLDGVYKFVEIGEEMSEGEASNLRNGIKNLSKSYFENMHKARMEAMSAMMENEMWQRCPVTRNFGFKGIACNHIDNSLDMKELKPFRNAPSSWEQKMASSKNMNTNAQSRVSAFASFRTSGNPFNNGYTKTQINADSESDDEAEPEELSVEKVDDMQTPRSGKGENNDADSGGPVLTTSTINVCRFVGKYVQMMKILQPIAFEIFCGLIEVYFFYVYTVYTFFAEEEEPPAYVVSIKLRAMLARLRKQFGHIQTTGMASLNLANLGMGLGTGNTPAAPAAPPQAPQAPNPTSPTSETDNVLTRKRFVVPKLSTNINDPSNLYGIVGRCVGIQSLSFVDQVITALKPHLQVLLPNNRDRNIAEFYNDAEIVPELIRYLYKKIVNKLLNWEELANVIANCKWDIKEFGIDHSPYVDWIQKELKTLTQKLDKEIKSGSGAISPHIRDMIMEETIKRIMEQLVEGYSRIKKCSNQGRALMSLDLQLITMGLDAFSPVKPIPNTVFVDTYIKAFYLPETELLKWCKEHQEYSLKQWLSIVNVGAGVNMAKKPKQDLVAALEELDRLKKSTFK